MSPNPASGPLRCLTASSTLFLILGLTGCAHTYRVKVDALCNADVAAGASYRIVPKDDVKADFDLNFAHSLQLIESALAARGLYRADDPRDADMIIEVDYGIGSRRKRVTESVDLFNASPANRTAHLDPRAQATPASNFDATGQPAPEVPVTRVTVITVFEKYLSLSARETSRATLGLRKPVELWRVTVAVEDTRETVDESLPLLAITAAERIGTNTNAREAIRVSGKPMLVAGTGR